MELDLITLAQYGVAGVAIGILVVFLYFIKVVFKFIGNHTNHQTEAIHELSTAITELTVWLKGKNAN